MAEGNITPEVSAKTIPQESGGRWDFLKKPFNVFKGEGAKEAATHILGNPSLGSEVFITEGSKVKVSWAKFTPEGKEIHDPKKVVIFLPGWSFQAKSPVTQDLPKYLSNEFGLATYDIDTVASKISPNALGLEAKAIRDFITQKLVGINEVTIFGHSEGGIKAANLAAILEQENPQIKINGVVLASSMGFYRQSFPELAKNFVIINPKVESQNQNPAVSHMPMSQVIFELAKSLLEDIRATKLKYPAMLVAQMKQLVSVDQAIMRIKSPVLILAADLDFVSNHREYLPKEEIENRLAEPMPAKDKTREVMVRNSAAREQYLREQVMPQAKQVKFFLATRYSGHGAIPVERAKQTAYIVSRIFDRMRRS